MQPHAGPRSARIGAPAMVEARDALRAGFSAGLTRPARLSQLYDAMVGVMSPGEQLPTPAPRPRTDVVASRGRLLIVEDNAINQAVARGMVAALGFACDVAGNGIEALEALERRHYDAVLMDCQMPGMDGFEATGEIRRREAAFERVPVIAMTAGALVEDRDRCFAAGMDDYLAKPVKRPELERVLGRWLPDGHVGRDEAEAPPPAPGTAAGDTPGATTTDGRVDVELLTEILGMWPSGPDGEPPAVLEMFLKETCNRIERARVASEAGDLVAVSRAAHSLKGASGAFGAVRLGALGAELEIASHRADAATVSSLLPVINSELEVFRDVLASRLEERAAAG